MNRGSRLWFVCAGCVVAAACVQPAVGDVVKDTSWTSAGGGAWADGNSWDNGVPDSNAAAIFDLGALSVYTVNLGAPGQAGELRARSGTIDLDLAWQGLAIAGVLFVGYDVGDSAYLRPSNGLLTSDWADVGHHAGTGGAPGRMTLSGAGTSWVNAYDVTVGRGTFGQVDVLAGAGATINGYAYVGNTLSGEPNSADGTLNVDGMGSQFATAGITIGAAGNGGAACVGTVNLTDGGTLTSTARQLQVGAGGQGYLNASGGSTISSVQGGSASNTSGLLGTASPGYTGQAYVTLNDPGTTWTQDGSLAVGFTGQGTLTVQAGAFVSSRWGHIARRAGSTGQATISGGGSNWAVQEELYVGGEAAPVRGGLGAGGTGVLDVRDGATVTVGQRLELWDQGIVNVTAGGAVMVGSGVFPGDPNRLYVGGGGVLAGTGTVSGTVVNLGGVVAPGHSFGTLAVEGFDQQGGLLEVEIGGLLGGADHDVLNVLADANLGGTLRLIFTNGFLPKAGDTFDLITAGQVLRGGFDEVQILGLADGWDYDCAKDGGTLRLISNNDAAPEPATLALLGLGALALARRRR